jgi:hypothetical protein
VPFQTWHNAWMEGRDGGNRFLVAVSLEPISLMKMTGTV